MKLFYFVPLNIEQCLKKGNMTYLRCFEVYFDRSFIIYFNSEKTYVKRIGKTIYIGIGGSRFVYFNVLISPFLLLSLYQRIKPDVCVTTDWIYSFWSTLLIRFKKRYFFYPVCYIGEALKAPTTDHLPNKMIENLFIKLSLLCAPNICVVPSQLKNDPFWEESRLTRDKLYKLNQTVEEYPSLEFLQRASLSQPVPETYANRSSIKLVTIGRLHKTKLFDEAIKSAKILIDQGLNVDLFILGDGDERSSLKKLAVDSGIDHHIHLMGSIPNKDLVPFLQHGDIYFSTLTGTALREAILCGLPIVTYKHPMTQMYFEEYGSLGYITAENTPRALAKGVLWYLNNKDKHPEIMKNISILKQRWSLTNLEKSLHETFDPYLSV